MKYTFLFLTLVVFAAKASDSPETIFPKTKIIRSADWYATQADRWHLKISENNKLAEAWLNYYAAARYAQFPQDRLNAIVSDMEKSGVAGFEYFFVKGWNQGFTEEGFQLMKGAYEMAPGNAATYGAMVLYGEWQLDAEARKEFSRKLFATNLVSASLLNYSYNVLMSLEKNAVLITEGDHTALPLFLLQDQLNIGRDVTILNLDLLLDNRYRERKLKAAHLAFLENTSGHDLKKILCMNLPDQNPGRTFYYALTLAKENMDPVREQLFVVGLASQLSKERLDNVAIIKQNLESRFLMDYLAVDLNGESEFASGKAYQSNYLVPLLILNDYYKSLNEHEKSTQIESIALSIANQTGQMTVVNNYLNRNKVITNPFSDFDPESKAHEISVKQVKGTIYAGEYEVTNEMYNRFLAYLQRKGLHDLYEQYKIDLSQYTEPAFSFMKSYSADKLVTRKEKYYTQHPVVNVSHESATAYCDWLTAQYNSDPAHKFKKVKISLPTVKQWQIAALGYKEFQSWNLEENKVKMTIPKDPKMEIAKEGKEVELTVKEGEILYPWFGAYNYRNKVLNSHGCSLGNFKFPESQMSCNPKYKMNTADGYFSMAPTAVYFPNGMGLYDVVGNVAEMTDEKGKACGGSWNHVPAESTIKSINEYKGPDAAIGFRIFMEVIEP